MTLFPFIVSSFVSASVSAGLVGIFGYLYSLKLIQYAEKEYARGFEDAIKKYQRGKLVVGYEKLDRTKKFGVYDKDGIHAEMTHWGANGCTIEYPSTNRRGFGRHIYNWEKFCEEFPEYRRLAPYYENSLENLHYLNDEQKAWLEATKKAREELDALVAK